MSDLRLTAPETNKTQTAEVSENSAKAGNLLREAAIAVLSTNIALAQKQSESRAAAHTGQEESSNEMASRLLLSTAAGYGTRTGCLMTGLHRVPKLGAAVSLAAPFIISGLSSSYLKTGDLTDLERY